MTDDGPLRLRPGGDLSLDPDLHAPAAARRLVRELLAGAGHDAWIDAAELAVSELVTNAVLHAQTAIEVSVAVSPQDVRVEVRDYSPTGPRQRSYGAQATTGRGMGMVAAMTDRCGVIQLDDGKVAWFTLTGAAAEPTLEEVLAAFEEEQWEVTPSTPSNRPAVDPPPPTGRVVLEGVPPTLWMAAQEHHDAILRELRLYSASHPETTFDFAGAEVARTAVLDLVAVEAQEAPRGTGRRVTLPEGHPSPLREVRAPVDITLQVLPGAAASSAALQDVLDAGEQLAADGSLLAFPGQPEIVAVRDWVCEQVQSQLRGVPPRPWAGSAHTRFEVDAEAVRSSAEIATIIEHVRSSPRGVVASDARNRILAVSAGLAASLGWDVDDLVGRRIVTLIPPSLREAHIAGFSRHLSTGRAHVLGVPLELPVLHASGHELPCDFLIEQVGAGAGQSLYLAWIDPRDPGERGELPKDVADAGPRR
ncbi:ATP-binding protein [Cellulomonas sp. NS3]|uniref:ATP-binding protein n=1 Tax=Cellulomonas sp. NS3 TaxID=2973977 RepID=UPI002163B443|nr:ATP-binding protein [Cellulomonas sp. NS3]